MEEKKVMPRQALLLGLLGLIPFLSLPFLHWTSWFENLNTIEAFTLYSAIILSFFGGVHWHASLTAPAHQIQIYIAMTPSILAWLAVAFGSPVYSLWILLICYLAILVYDLLTLKMPKGYGALRTGLTLVAGLCHWWMIWQINLV